MLAGALLFALMGALTHALGPRCDWRIIAFVRVLVMFLAMIAIARAAGARLVVWDPPSLWTRSLAGSFSLVCNFFALTRLPIADAITLSNTYPLWIVLLTALLLRQAPTAGEILGVASGLVGVVLIQRPQLQGDGRAAAVALLASLATALAMLGLHRLRGIDARAIMAHFAGVASLVAGTWVVLRWGSLEPVPRDPGTWLLLLGVGVTGTTGQFFLTRAYVAGPPTKVSVVGLSQVVFAMGLDAALWHRTMTLRTLVGFALVLAPTAWLLDRAGRRQPAPNPYPPPPASTPPPLP
jgi:drug/metabolite transporter (DMT)-like permease